MRRQKPVSKIVIDPKKFQKLWDELIAKWPMTKKQFTARQRRRAAKKIRRQMRLAAK